MVGGEGLRAAQGASDSVGAVVGKGDLEGSGTQCWHSPGSLKVNILTTVGQVGGSCGLTAHFMAGDTQVRRREVTCSRNRDWSSSRALTSTACCCPVVRGTKKSQVKFPEAVSSNESAGMPGCLAGSPTSPYSSRVTLGKLLAATSKFSSCKMGRAGGLAPRLPVRIVCGGRAGSQRRAWHMLSSL